MMLSVVRVSLSFLPEGKEGKKERLMSIDRSLALIPRQPMSVCSHCPTGSARITGLYGDISPRRIVFV
jgi:hypothetical protein